MSQWTIKLDAANPPQASLAMYAANRRRTADALIAAGAAGIVVIWGSPPAIRPPSDFEGHFRNESMLLWLGGVNVPDCAVILDLGSGKWTLVYADQDPDMVMWSGPLPSLDDLKVRYGFEEVIFQSDLRSRLDAAEKIYTMSETFPADLSDLSAKVDKELVLEVIGGLRQVKSAEEVALIQYACDVNSKAFQKALRKLKAGQRAYQVVSYLSRTWLKYNCISWAFTPIASVGSKAAVLHGPDLTGLLAEGALVLIDAGCEYCGYASDNTRTVPVNGKFSDDQRGIYQAVLDAHNEVLRAAKPGVFWPDLGQLSARVLAAGLIKVGLLTGTVDEVVDAGAVLPFYPHGLGHGMGLDTHEICGWPKGSVRPPEPHRKRVRFGRELKEGVVITVEPGCYFLPELFGPFAEQPEVAKHINFDLARRFVTTVGGVRIEDDIVITADGCRSLSRIPKEIADIEAFMARS